MQLILSYSHHTKNNDLTYLTPQFSCTTLVMPHGHTRPVHTKSQLMTQHYTGLIPLHHTSWQITSNHIIYTTPNNVHTALQHSPLDTKPHNTHFYTLAHLKRPHHLTRPHHNTHTQTLLHNSTPDRTILHHHHTTTHTWTPPHNSTPHHTTPFFITTPHPTTTHTQIAPHNSTPDHTYYSSSHLSFMKHNIWEPKVRM